jgi:nicotinate-nucleotide adenylyltransferase
MKVAVFGGSFNPPHVAHALAALLVLSTEDVDRLLVVPAYQHPFGKPLAPFTDRAAMCDLAMGWIPGVEVSRVEESLGGESRTLRTLEHLASQHPDWQLRLVVGADILTEAPRWFGFDAIAKLAPPIVLARAGVASAGAVEAGRAATSAQPRVSLPQVSSTDVRAKIAEGAWEDLESLVPRKVLAYVRAKRLYGAPG